MKVALGRIGLGLLIALLSCAAGPRIAVAASTIVVAPAEGPVGSYFAVAGSGFAPNEPLTAQITRPSGVTEPPVSLPADSAGNLINYFTADANDGPGRYGVEYRNAAGAVVGGYSVLVTASGTPAPALAIAPRFGPPGTRFSYIGVNFTPGERITPRKAAVNFDPATTGDIIDLHADAKGLIFGSVSITPTHPTGDFLLEARTECCGRGTVRASAPFRVGDAPAPSTMPGTGGGGMAGATASARAWPLALTLGAMLLTTAAMRRKATRREAYAARRVRSVE
jgi:hypothetical protein